MSGKRRKRLCGICVAGGMFPASGNLEEQNL